MSPLAWVAMSLLGGIGAIARFAVDGIVSERVPGEFPGGTFVVNASGAALLGLVTGLAIRGDALLIFGGALTALPLLLFTAAAKRLPYSTLGFLQYVAPSLQFLLAVAVFGEPLTGAHILCFGAIWTSLALFVGEGLRLGRAAARARAIAV